MSRKKQDVFLTPDIMFSESVTLAHRDWPFHDHKKWEDNDEPAHYVVGKDQVDAHGDQSKLFVSKSTLIYSDVACTIRLNNTDNVTINIIANNFFEFKSNIRSIYILTIAQGGTLYAWFEGVEPQEARSGI